MQGPDLATHFKRAQSLVQSGQSAAAKPILEQLYQLAPTSPEVAHLFAIVEHQLGNHPNAEQVLRKLIKVHPGFVPAHNNLGVVLSAQGKFKQARACYSNLIKLKPAYPDAYANLSAVLLELNEDQKAAQVLQDGLKQVPEHPELHYALATVLAKLGRIESATEGFQKVLALQANHAAAANNLGCMLSQAGEEQQAVEAFSQAIEAAPHHAEAHYNRGKSLQKLQQSKVAEADFRQARALDPSNAEFSFGLARNDLLAGRISAALSGYQQVLDKDPRHANALSNMLMSSHYAQDLSDAEVQALHKNAVKEFVAQQANLPAFKGLSKTRSAQKPLRVGYLSPDFREHSVAYFFLPLIRHHSAAVEVYCYYNNHSSKAKPDAMTEQIKGHASVWREVKDWDDARLVKQVRKDDLDVLVDLAGHTADSRVLAMAARMAPIQVTWLGYPGITGVPNIDYRIVDRITDPDSNLTVPAKTAEQHEHLLALPNCFVCYAGKVDVEGTQEPPFTKNGYVTFGSFNNFFKLNDELIKVWARILGGVPQSRLMIKNAQLDDADIVAELLAKFEELGISANRLTLLGKISGKQDHLYKYNDLDIALDTFPYNGTTTTMEALWMSVPVIAYAGDRHAARVSASLLQHAGLGSLVADDVDQYVTFAQDLARDPERLQELRRTLRETLLSSAVTDAQSFAMDMEALYQQLVKGPSSC